MALSDVGLINFGGLATGLDTKALIDAIMRVERRPLDRLEQRQTVLNQKKSAYDELRSKLSEFAGTLRELSLNRTFLGRTTTLSDETFFKATARPGAETGVFSVEVFELAVAHKVKSEGLSASDDGLVSDGTITIQSGDNDLITVDVSASSGNNTMEAVRDAIDDADAGVQASILFDGSVYRLIVRAEETGEDNALTITDSTNLDLDDPANEVAAANDARIEVDGIEVTSSSNQITGVIQGVTLDLLSTTTGTGVSLQVDEDIEGVIEAVQSLVSDYNDLITFFNSQFDPEAPGPLGSDGTTRRIQLNLQSLVTAGVPGIPVGEIRSLSAIGVSFEGRTGKMSLDTAELRELLEERFDEVSRLFTASGITTDPRISYSGSTAATRAGEYAVEITQAAEKASVVGSAPISAGGINRDETLTITANGESTSVALTKNMKIGEIVDAINAELQSSGVDATASDDNGSLRISTTAYGSDQTITVVSDLNDSGNGKQTGFDDSPTTDTGQDVAGKIGGVDATGSGQFLTGAGDYDFEGLTLRVTATAADIVATGGDFGTVSFSPGLVKTLQASVDETLRLGDGPIDSAREVLTSDLKGISEEIDRLEERLVARQARLVRIFAEAERAIAVLQAQQAQLGSVTLG